MHRKEITIMLQALIKRHLIAELNNDHLADYLMHVCKSFFLRLSVCMR